MTAKLITLLGPEMHKRYLREKRKVGATAARRRFNLPERGPSDTRGEYFRAHALPTDQPPQVRWLFEEMNRQRMSLRQASRRSGVHVDTFRSWRRGAAPTLASAEAVANVLGFTFQVTKLAAA